MLYDDKEIDSASPEEDEEEEEKIVRSKKSKKSKNRNKKQTKSSSSSKSKKSKAIIEDDEDEDDEEEAVDQSTVLVKELVGSDDDDDDEDEDEDEEAAEGEFNGFIDDNEGLVEDEVDSDDDETEKRHSSDGHKKKKKKKKEKPKKKKKKNKQSSSDGSSGSGSGSSSQSSDNSDLSDDDIDLIKDNLQVDDLEEIGIAAKKRRRVRLASDSSEEEKTKPKVSKKHSKLSQRSIEQRPPQKGQKKRRDDSEQDEMDSEGERIDNEIVESEEQSGESSQEEGVQRGHGANDESDDGNFIVDDSDDENKEMDEETREMMRRAKESNKKKRVYNDEAQQEALDIFGVNAEDLGALSDDTPDDEEYDEDEEELEDDEEDEDDDLENDGEDEDDYTQKTKTKRQKQQRLKVMHKMEDIFEPQELVKNLLTEFDQQVRIEDKPERFMLRSLPVTSEPDDLELEREARWIFNQAFQGKKTVSDQQGWVMKQDDKMDEAGNVVPSPVVGRIKDVLNFLRNEFLEVPFIAHYRKEYIRTKETSGDNTPNTDLDIDDLWKIYEMDEKYCQLKIRKENFIKLLERMQHYQTVHLNNLKQRRYVRLTTGHGDEDECDEEEDPDIANRIDSARPLDNTDLERVRSAQTVDEFLDCYHHFHLHYGPDLIPMKQYEAKMQHQVNNPEEEIDPAEDPTLQFNKYASRKDRFHHCKQVGLWSLANKFGLTCEQFGENLVADYQLHDIDQCAIEPSMLAMDYVREPYFQNVEQVLSAVKYMVSIQLAKDPVVRGCVREMYMQNSCLNVRPVVPRGLKEIDETHQCYPFKYLSMKPCSKLRGDEYYKLDQAEREGLITIKFETSQIKTYITAAGSKKAVNGGRGGDDDDWEDDSPVKSMPAQNQVTSFERSLIEKLKAVYHKDEFSYNVEQWNALRGQVIEEMCVKHLWPEFEKELRGRLLREAKSYVYEECATKLKSILERGPYVTGEVAVMSTMNLEDCGVRVVSVAYSNNEDGDEKSLACATYVNGNGEMEEYVGLRHLNLRLFRDRETGSYTQPTGYMSEQKEEKIQDLEKLEEFLVNKKPNLIVLSAENKDTLGIQQDLQICLEKAMNREPALANTNIELVNPEFSKLFRSSKVCEAEFGINVPGIVKQSIAMARQLQDPLLCYAQLCNQERDILGFKFHPMQQTMIGNSGGRMSDDCSELLKRLEIEFVNSVNQVGVDINRCNIAPHTAHVLQYVSGLGPRKAQHIVKVLRHQRQQDMTELPPDKQIRTHPVATNRLFLVTKCTLGRRVFINCAGFIKYDVDMIDQANNDEDEDFEKQPELLDSTRIHPEHYDWARKMGIDAMDKDDQDNEEINTNSVLKEVIENPKVLKELDLDAFASELERTGYGNKNQTLYDIRAELSGRYKDWRKPWVPMTPDQIFFCLIKETPQTLYTGKLVLARVIGIVRRRPTKQQRDESNPIKDEATLMWSCEFCKRNDFSEIGQVWNHFDVDGECQGMPVGVKCMLDNGCSGFLSLKFLSDSRVENPDERIKDGMTINARITRIDPEKFSVDLTSRTSDLRDSRGVYRPQKDEFFDVRAADEDQFKLDEKKRKEEHKPTYQKRIIAHPQFRNIGYAQTAVLLSEMDIGDAIIRPSSKGNNHLTISWKINNNCYQHIDVLEDKKLNEFSIGKRLLIDGEEFEDLDEILARYIGALSNYVREIISHKNYRDAEQLNAQLDQSQTDLENSALKPPKPIKIENIERALLEEREKNKAKIPYMFTGCIDMPGKFLLSYLIKVKLRNEYIKVTSEGFKFREKIFASFNELITWFKQHFMDPIPVVRPSATQSQPGYKDTKISSQMSTMSIDQSRNDNNNHRTPAYPAPSRTPAHMNSATFDSVVNNSQSNQGSSNYAEPAEYSTTGYDNNYSAPGTLRYREESQGNGDYGRSDRGRRSDRGGRGGRGGRDFNRPLSGYNNSSKYNNRESNAPEYKSYNNRGSLNNNNNNSFNSRNNNSDNSLNKETRRSRPSRFTDNTDPQPMDTSQTPVTYSQPGANNWDDDELARPPINITQQQPSNNRFNNNKTPSYEAASKTPNYAPNKTPSHISNDDDDWDDEQPSDFQKQMPFTANRFVNNKTPSYVPPVAENPWDADERHSVPNVNNNRNGKTNRFSNNNNNNYNRGNNAHNIDDDNWDDNETVNTQSRNIVEPVSRPVLVPKPVAPVTNKNYVDDDDWDD